MATKSSVTGNAAAKSSAPKAAEEQVCTLLSKRLQRVSCHCLRIAAAVLVVYSFAVTAWRVRHQPQDLAFVAAALFLLAELQACLRRAERLAPESPAGERRRVRAAVWALSTALSCAFAYRVAAVMPPPLAVLVWCITASVGLVGLCLLVLCRDQQYQALRNDDAACDCDRRASAKTSPTDELV
ncbi:uncharacterized protein LOC100277300 [Zea mays]|jgi:hypothetical protein|uniref:Os05g0181800-like protein n=1 Tax=Zea mays TaxID=4577 RepID=B6TSI5_MAIZE|nr:uncharacterized protein LOC100277300 [Zea mays]ACG40068.1 hypothetical protein [Zea mays]AQK93126.1 Os05g0181800-like protein [Zea mays]|eukprot:NP_001144377.1 uncharacterized LOC100277300 [Zea mays]